MYVSAASILCARERALHTCRAIPLSTRPLFSRELPALRHSSRLRYRRQDRRRRDRSRHWYLRRRCRWRRHGWSSLISHSNVYNEADSNIICTSRVNATVCHTKSLGFQFHTLHPRIISWPEDCIVQISLLVFPDFVSEWTNPTVVRPYCFLVWDRLIPTAIIRHGAVSFRGLPRSRPDLHGGSPRIDREITLQ